MGAAPGAAPAGAARDPKATPQFSNPAGRRETLDQMEYPLSSCYRLLKKLLEVII